MKKTLSTQELKEFKTKINLAFRDLRKAGYFAKQDFWCCQSCAWSDIPDETKKVVFYHKQDTNDLKQGSFHLAWAGNAHEIIDILRSCGLVVVWKEDESKRINVRFENENV